MSACVVMSVRPTRERNRNRNQGDAWCSGTIVRPCGQPSWFGPQHCESRRSLERGHPFSHAFGVDATSFALHPLVCRSLRPIAPSPHLCQRWEPVHQNGNPRKGHQLKTTSVHGLANLTPPRQRGAFPHVSRVSSCGRLLMLDKHLTCRRGSWIANCCVATVTPRWRRRIGV